jgi:frataxin-like iron-binding protein CyaY
MNDRIRTRIFDAKSELKTVHDKLRDILETIILEEDSYPDNNFTEIFADNDSIMIGNGNAVQGIWITHEEGILIDIYNFEWANGDNVKIEELSSETILEIIDLLTKRLN